MGLHIRANTDEPGEGVKIGSYTAYNTWLDHLETMIAGDTIAFSEQMEVYVEGEIHATTAAKLAKDYADWADRAKAYAVTLDEDWSMYFLHTFHVFREAFEKASTGGAVIFC